MGWIWEESILDDLGFWGFGVFCMDGISYTVADIEGNLEEFRVFGL